MERYQKQFAVDFKGKPCVVSAHYAKPEGKLEEYMVLLELPASGLRRKVFAYEGLPFFVTDSHTGGSRPLAQALIEQTLDHAWSLVSDRINDLLTDVVLDAKAKTRKGRSATGSGEW